MYKVKVISHFSAAHFLRNYAGKCEVLHGHNWKVEVMVSNKGLDSSGMVMDFSCLKKITKNILKELDHCNLNDLEYFKKHNPSSEEIARYIYDCLREDISAKGCFLDKVRVWETESSCAVYQE